MQEPTFFNFSELTQTTLVPVLMPDRSRLSGAISSAPLPGMEVMAWVATDRNQVFRRPPSPRRNLAATWGGVLLVRSVAGAFTVALAHHYRSAMRHAKFTITWPDGQRAVAEIEAPSPEQNFPVAYSGEFRRLGDPPRESDVAFLAFVMRVTAEKTSGTFSEEYSGCYDRWAGGPHGL